MENELFAALDKGDPVSLLQIQESAELARECHLASTSDFAGNHLIFPFLSDIFTMCRKFTILDGKRQQVRTAGVRFVGDLLIVQLSDGRELSVPLDRGGWLKWLRGATPEQRANWSIEPRGFAIYWEDLDDGIELSHLLTVITVGVP